MTRSSKVATATKRPKLGPVLWLATDGEVLIADKMPGESGYWLCVVGTYKGEPRETLEECVNAREELTVLSKRVPDARIYAPLIEDSDPTFQREMLKRYGTLRAERSSMNLVKFGIDVRRSILRQRLLAQAKKNALASGLLDPESVKRELGSAILAIRAKAQTTGDQEAADALAGDVDALVRKIVGA